MCLLANPTPFGYTLKIGSVRFGEVWFRVYAGSGALVTELHVDGSLSLAARSNLRGLKRNEIRRALDTAGDNLGALLALGKSFMEKTKGRVVTTDAEIDALIEQANLTEDHVVVLAEYDAREDAIVVRFKNGVGAIFPRRLLQGLEAASAEQLSDIVIEGGAGLLWPKLGDECAHFVPNMLEGYFGTRKWMAELNGRKGGSSTSAAKKRAAQRNGKKGGRPRVAAPVK